MARNKTGIQEPIIKTRLVFPLLYGLVSIKTLYCIKSKLYFLDWIKLNFHYYPVSPTQKYKFNIEN